MLFILSSCFREREEEHAPGSQSFRRISCGMRAKLALFFVLLVKQALANPSSVALICETLKEQINQNGTGFTQYILSDPNSSDDENEVVTQMGNTLVRESRDA